MKHTPGEWHLSHSPVTARKLSNRLGFGRYYKSVKNRLSIGGTIISTAYGNIAEEAEANAKLIAAAPELLEVLRRVRKWHMDRQVLSYPVDEIEAVINKAT